MSHLHRKIFHLQGQVWQRQAGPEEGQQPRWLRPEVVVDLPHQEPGEEPAQAHLPRTDNTGSVQLWDGGPPQAEGGGGREQARWELIPNFEFPENCKVDVCRCLTANKFNLDIDPVAVLCQAKEIVHRTEMLYWRKEDENT